jgi:hypothetical protein
MLFRTPLLLLDSLYNFSLETPNKIIHVMDPTTGSWGLNATKQLKLTANLIQKDIFECIQKYFADWQVDKFNLSKRFPILVHPLQEVIILRCLNVPPYFLCKYCSNKNMRDDTTVFKCFLQWWIRYLHIFLCEKLVSKTWN